MDLEILNCCLDKELFRDWFKDTHQWRAWFAFLRAMFGLPMKKEHRKIYEQCTSRTDLSNKWYREGWLVVGRRGGKSRILALIAVYLACFVDWQPYLSPGEEGTIIIIAVDKRQARVIFRYIEAFLTTVPMLKSMIEKHNIGLFELTNNVTIEIHTASFRTVRGYTLIAALLDEIAFFRSEESSNPDYEILEAIRPGMATMPWSMILCASSPHARRGVLWEHYDRYFGQKDDQILVWKAPTWYMNPIVPDYVYEQAERRDPAKYMSEYGAEFRTDVERLVTREIVDACTVQGRQELIFRRGQTYVAFVDPSGGSADSFTLAIAHREGDDFVLDLVRERKPPFSPDDVVNEFVSLCKNYHISFVTGDRYGGEWPRERFRKKGIVYEVSDKNKSEIYLALLPLLNSTQIKLLDNKRLATQLITLERRTTRGGRDIIDHEPGSFDDLINSAAGALVNLEKFAALEMW